MRIMRKDRAPLLAAVRGGGAMTGEGWLPDMEQEAPTTLDTAVSWIKGGKAFDPKVLSFAARFAIGTETFQACLAACREAKVNLNHWQAGVKPYRKLRVVGEGEGGDPVEARLLRDKGGNPRKTVANAITILVHDARWADVLAYDALSDRVVKLKDPPWHEDDTPQDAGPSWTDADITRAQAWIAREYHLDLGVEAMGAAVWAAAERHVIDPLKDYFEGRRGAWDGVARVDTWLSVYLGVRDTEYSRAIGRRFLIGAVARALVSRHSTDGEKVDNVPILEGPQGIGKSGALRRLCPVPGLFFDSELAIGEKDADQALRGKFLIELPELSALSRHDFRVLKAFVTRQVDTYRPSFGRMSRDFPRRCVFVGTTNDDEYLKDPTGNRRWQPVRAGVVGAVDWAGIERDRDQIWAEALTLREKGERHDVDSAALRALCEEEQQAREQTEPWAERVAAHLEARLSAAKADHGTKGDKACDRCVYCVGVTTAGVLGALGLALDKQGRAEEMRVAQVIRGMGWQKSPKRKTVNGARVWPYHPPDAVLVAEVDQIGEVGQQVSHEVGQS